MLHNCLDLTHVVQWTIKLRRLGICERVLGRPESDRREDYRTQTLDGNSQLYIGVLFSAYGLRSSGPSLQPTSIVVNCERVDGRCRENGNSLGIVAGCS